MKKMAMAMVGFAVAATSATLPMVVVSATITDVIVRQQWPWSGKVNIDYVLSDPDDGVHDINVVLRNGESVITNQYGSLSGDLIGVKQGVRRIVWDPMCNGATYSDKVMASFSVTLSTSDDAATYMVVDLSGGATAAEYPVTFTNRPPEGGWNQIIYKTDKLVLRRIPAGSFMMGSPEDELGRVELRELQHMVTLTNDFYIGIFEVTRAQYSNMVHTVTEYSAGESGSAIAANNLTVGILRGEETMSDANYKKYTEGSVLGLFNAKFSFDGEYADYVFDLPTMSQWEYACRAGVTAALNDGNNITNVDKDVNVGNIAWYRHNTSLSIKTCGGKPANAYGLYDMHGNVSELCLDKSKGSSSAYWWTTDDLVEPLCVPDNWFWPKGVAKGGHAQYKASQCRSASVGTPDNCTGFRIAFVRDRFAVP